MRLILFLLLTALQIAPAAARQAVTVTTAGEATLLNNGGMATTYHLTVNGTLACDPGTLLRFEGTNDQMITGGAPLTVDDFLLAKPSGDVLLTTNLFVNGTLSLSSGDLDLGGVAIDLGATGMLSETPGNTVKGTAGVITARRTLNAPNALNVAGLGAEITSLRNLGVTIITRSHAAQTSGSDQGILRYFDITPTTNTGLNAMLVFHYDESELNRTPELDLSLFRSTDGGTTWTGEGGIPNSEANTVTLSGIDAFSRWTLAGTGLLPVELTSFEAQVDGAAVVLTWQTASETNNAGFEVQVREGGRENGQEHTWDRLAFIDGYGTTLEPQSYAHRVEALTPGRHVFRLKQLDYDGGFEYSPEVEVAVELPVAFLLTSAYPNPFNPQTQLSLMVKRRQEVAVSVYDALGRQVEVLYRGTMEAEQARSLVFEAGSLPSGLYVIRAEGETFVAMRKVMLVK